ncbi:MAG TPA: hypothetical protein VGF30_00075 [Bacteroidia bacterium]
MSLIRLFQAIDNSFVGSFVERKLEIVKDTDPDKIYVENIRQFYNMPNFAAKFLCTLAVREGLFVKKIEILCPQCRRVIKIVNDRREIPDTVDCIVCRMEEKDVYEFSEIGERQIRDFYQLVR